MHLRLLGPVQAVRDGRTLQIHRRQERRLLAVLAMRPGRFHSADRLVDLLWDTHPPARARAGLQAMISHLRSALELHDHDEPRLTTQRQGYALDIAPGLVDVHRFRALVDESRAVADPLHRVDILTGALDLWRGVALADVFDDEQRTRLFPELDEIRLAAREELIEAQLTAGRHRQAVQPARALVGEHPVRERAVQLLMLALDGDGRRGEALAAFAALAARLAGEFGIEPGDRITATHQALLRPAGPAEPAAPSGPAPAQLPLPPVHFVGRAAELGELDRLLTGPGTPPVLILTAVVGAAGIGKTATAVHWARHVRAGFPDGQLFLNLRGHSAGRALRPGEALAALLRGLGVPTARIPADADEAAALYRTTVAGRRLLILLDNAADSDQVRPLLPGSPGSLVVVTSRDRLTGLVVRDNAHRLTVGLLAEADAALLLTTLLGTGRCAAEPWAVDALARACGYLPLALRIAAAQLIDEPATPVSAYVRQLGLGGTAALAVDNDPSATVQTAFDLSYSRQPETARRIFRLLGVAPGTALPIAAVAHLAAGSPAATRSALDRLGAAHLVDVDGERVTMHDLLRRYAAERGATRAETATARQRLFAWYTVRAEAAGDLLAPGRTRLALPPGVTAGDAGFADRDSALAWLDAEEANMVALIRSAADGPSQAAAALLADQLRAYFWVSRNSMNWLVVAQAALRAADATGDPRLRAASHMSLGNVHHAIGHHLIAVAHHRRAVRLFRRAGLPDMVAAAVGSLGAVHGDLSDLTTAAACFEHALRVNRHTGHRHGVAVMLSNLGTVYAMAGRFRLAAERCTAAADIHGDAGARPNEAVVRTNLGQIRMHLGEYPAAITELTLAVRIAQEIGMAAIEANARITIGQIHLRTGDPAAAEAAFAAAADLAARSGDELCGATIHIAEGALHLARGDRDRAAHVLTKAAQWARTAHIPAIEAEALAGLSMAVAPDEPRRAGSLAQRAVILARQAGAVPVEIEAVIALAEAARFDADPERAIGYATQAAQRAAAMEMPLTRARALAILDRLSLPKAAAAEVVSTET